MSPDGPKRETDRGDAAVSLRPYVKADFSALFALDQVCFPPDIAYSSGELKYFLAHPRTFTIVAERGGAIAGFCLTERIRESGQLAGHVITIDVAPEARRAGVGSLLIDAMERKLVDGGAGMLRLEVAVDNEAAQRFYGRHGFVQTGRMRGYYAGRLDAFTMAKSLFPSGSESGGKLG